MESTTRKLPMKNALFILKAMHGLEMAEPDFEDIAMIAWRKIGNRDVCLFSFEAEPDAECFLELPCNVLHIEAVSSDWDECPPYGILGNRIGDYRQAFPIYQFSAKSAGTHRKEFKGSLVNYSLEDGGMRIMGDYRKVTVYYTGLNVDEDGLPLINEKESLAIAYYCAYIMMHRKMLGGIAQAAQLVPMLKQESDRHMRDARVPEKLSQNFMDSILNVRASMNRKWFNKPFNAYKDV